MPAAHLDPAPQTRPPHIRHAHPWRVTVVACLAVTVLTGLAGALVPTVKATDLYLTLGPLLMVLVMRIGALVAALPGTAVIAIVAWWVGIRRWGYALVVCASAHLAFVAFLAGDSLSLYDAPGAHRRAAAQAEVIDPIHAHRARLQPAIARQDVAAPQRVPGHLQADQDRCAICLPAIGRTTMRTARTRQSDAMDRTDPAEALHLWPRDTAAPAGTRPGPAPQPAASAFGSA